MLVSIRQELTSGPDEYILYKVPLTKEQAIHLHNQHLAQKTALETLAYTDGSGINNHIGSACIILGQRKAIKKFLGTDKTSTVYMGEMQGIQDSLTYATN